jgi:O-succinylbenzoate synthase
MKLDRIILRELHMPLVAAFEASFGPTTERRIVLVEVRGQGAAGWGEAAAPETPFYNEEDTETAWHIIQDYVAPRLLGREVASAAEIHGLLKHIRGHNFAKGGVEAAAWELEARLQARPLWQHIGGIRREIPCGVSIGIKPSVEELLDTVQCELDAGYQRIKIKIKPGWDVEVIASVRRRFPSICLMADANGAYTSADTEHLKRLDDYYLMMLEQPLGPDDLYGHARLQAWLETPICLDECIRSVDLAEAAIRMGACRIINIKLGRVGGFAEAKRVHDVAQAHSIPVWCGGMLESGVGRAHNVALSTLPNFVLPGDVSASKRYWKRDIIKPAVEVGAQGVIAVSGHPGMGYDLDLDYIDSITVRKQEIAQPTS